MRALGYFLLALPFNVLFFFFGREHGFATLFIALGLFIGVVVCVFVGRWLLDNY